MATMSRTISLSIYKHDQLVGSRSFSQEVIKIGKLRSSDLHLEDDAVARMHAVLEVTANDIRLVDLGSAAGTVKNGERIIKSAALASGDSLRVGPFRLELEVQPAAAVVAVPTLATVPAMGAAAPAPAAAMSLGAAAPALTPAPAPAPASPRAVLPVDATEVEQPERHVAEVVARYGSTVLDVQHVGQVRPRRQQAPALLALGGLMLLAGASIVGHEVSQDWEGHEAARAEAAAVGRAAPPAPGTGLGGLGMGLALLGLVPLGLGAVRRSDVGLERYTVGEGHDASFHVAADGLPDGEAFPLVSKQGEGYVLRFTAGMRGHVSIDGRRHGLDELVRAGQAGAEGSTYALPLPHGARAEIEHGGVAYQVTSVASGKITAKGNEADRPFWIYNAASGAVLGALLTLIHLIPEDALHMNMDELVSENRYVGYMQQPNLEPEVKEVVQPEQPSTEDAGGQGKRHTGAEGKMGSPKAPAKAGLYAMKGNKTAVQQMARDFDPELAARNTGILGLMQKESGHFLASPYGGAFAVGQSDADIWGGLTGTEAAEAFGTGGLGPIGTGRGGGGTGQGTIGLGNVGTIGQGGQGGTKSGYGPGGGSGTAFNDRGGRVPQIRQGKAVVQGPIDKEVIRRIIRSHHNEVRHCYNQGLVRDPNLQGRVAVMFTIGPAGTVPSAAVSETTLADRNVGNCVAGAVRRWKFPKPASGGTAMVTYPFTFTPG
jgi:TonB family protein